jgi:hypothetical protein
MGLPHSIHVRNKGGKGNVSNLLIAANKIIIPSLRQGIFDDILMIFLISISVGVTLGSIKGCPSSSISPGIIAAYAYNTINHLWS